MHIIFMKPSVFQVLLYIGLLSNSSKYKSILYLYDHLQMKMTLQTKLTNPSRIS